MWHLRFKSSVFQLFNYQEIKGCANFKFLEFKRRNTFDLCSLQTRRWSHSMAPINTLGMPLLKWLAPTHPCHRRHKWMSNSVVAVRSKWLVVVVIGGNLWEKRSLYLGLFFNLTLDMTKIDGRFSPFIIKFKMV